MARPSTATLEGQRAGVNDHFGKPSLTLGVDDSDFRHLQSTGHTGRLWVKPSGAYGWTCRRSRRVGKRLAAHTVRKRDQVSYGACEPGCARLPDLVNRRTVWFSHRSVFSSLRFSSALRPQLPCSDARNYLTHVTNALLLVGPDRNVRF